MKTNKADNTKLIIEGPDGIGKSTYLNFLSQWLDKKVIEFNKDNLNTFEFWQQALASNEATLWSRSFLSERIYADIFRRTPRLSDREEYRLFKLLRELGYQVIVLMPKDFETTLRRLKERGDYISVIVSWKLIVERYEQLIKKYKLKEVRV